MKDRFGTEIILNDIVACNTPRYRGLCLGTVIAFTPQKVKIQYNNTWNYGATGGHIETYLTEPINVVVNINKRINQ
jgi:hypothetical protein